MVALSFKWIVGVQPLSPNGVGTQNNKVLVKKSDFEVFEALALDSRATNKSKKHREYTGSHRNS